MPEASRRAHPPPLGLMSLCSSAASDSPFSSLSVCSQDIARQTPTNFGARVMQRRAHNLDAARLFE